MDLVEYTMKLISNGFDDVDNWCTLKDTDLKDIGLTSGAYKKWIEHFYEVNIVNFQFNSQIEVRVFSRVNKN